MTGGLRTPAAGELAYRGHGAGQPGGGRLVTVERDGEVLGLLRHVVKQSPTALSWGYAGFGPADLALSLLVDALGPWASCPACDGRARVAQRRDEQTGEGHGRVWPYDPQRHSPMRGGSQQWTVSGCWECENGLDPQLPYQQLKADVVAALPDAGWLLAQGQLLDWAAAHGVRFARPGADSR